jgi:hypothetical protein
LNDELKARRLQFIVQRSSLRVPTGERAADAFCGEARTGRCNFDKKWGAFFHAISEP